MDGRAESLARGNGRRVGTGRRGLGMETQDLEEIRKYGGGDRRADGFSAKSEPQARSDLKCCLGILSDGLDCLSRFHVRYASSWHSLLLIPSPEFSGSRQGQQCIERPPVYLYVSVLRFPQNNHGVTGLVWINAPTPLHRSIFSTPPLAASHQPSTPKASCSVRVAVVSRPQPINAA